MKATIEVSNGSYGFGKTWSLKVETKTKSKTFFLGQDAKVCHRLLQQSPRDVVNAIGDNDLGNEKTRNKLARYILSHIKEYHLITTRKLMTMESWDLAVE